MKRFLVGLLCAVSMILVAVALTMLGYDDTKLTLREFCGFFLLYFAGWLHYRCMERPLRRYWL